MESFNSGYPRSSHQLRQSDNSRSRSPYSRNDPQQAQLTEEEYEMRRQQELRRQIELRERELEMQSSNRDRLNRVTQQNREPINHHDVQDFRDPQPTFAARQPARNSNSPFRTRGEGSFGRVPEGELKSSVGSTVPHRQQAPRVPVPERPRDRSTHSSNSPMRLSQYLAPTVEHQSIPSQGRLAPTEYLSQLRRDNESLQRRLNLVLAELDRINRERAQLQGRLGEVSAERDHIEHSLNDQNRTHDDMNRGVQSDLANQKDHNRDIQHRVATTESVATDTLARLRLAQAERERCQANGDSIKSELTQKRSHVDNLERERAIASEQLARVTLELDDLSRHEHTENHAIRDLQLSVDRLAMERDDLQGRLEHMSREYDTTVFDVSRDRDHLVGRSIGHQKLLVAKNSFMLLEGLVMRRKQYVMNEFFNYCHFDQKCHETLKRFVQILERVGHFKMRVGLKQWYQKTFKPVECRKQQLEAIDMRSMNSLQRNFFYKWRKAYLGRTNQYASKGKALTRMWGLKRYDVGKEVLRAFTIWRDAARYDKMREHKLRQRIIEIYRQKLQNAWNRWMLHRNTENMQIRMHLLARQFAQDQLLQVTFTQMRQAIQEGKRRRLQRLRTYLNAWKTSQQYRKYMMASNLAAAKFLGENAMVTKKNCFDALRYNKETEKHILMHTALHEETLPAIEMIKSDFAARTARSNEQNRNRVRDAIQRMIYRQAASYFYKWKDECANQNLRVTLNLRRMLIRRNHSDVQRAFHFWRKGGNWMDNTLMQAEINELSTEAKMKHMEISVLNSNIANSKKVEDHRARKGMRRAMQIWQNRHISAALQKWRDFCEFGERQEEGRDLIIKKMRNRFLKQAFRIYQDGVKFRQQEDKNQERAIHFAHTSKMRRIRMVFNALCQFVHKFKKSKVYWSLLLGKMDAWMKRRAFLTWQNQANKKVEDLLKAKQNQASEEFGELNTELGFEVNRLETKQRKNADLQAGLIKQGSRILSNYFARWFYTKEARAFEQWRQSVKYSKHVETVLNRFIDHWRRYKFYQVKAAFQNHNLKARVAETAAGLQHKQMEREEAQQMVAYNAQIHTQNNATRQLATDEAQAAFQILEARLGSTMTMLVRKNNNCYFQDNRRFILQQWRAFVQRQKNFTTRVKDALEKSMWHTGFQHIRAFANDKKQTRSQNKAVNFTRMLFWKRNCGSAFSKWRENLHFQAVDDTNRHIDMINFESELHNRKYKAIQKNNLARSHDYMRKNDLRDYLKGWKNVVAWIKQARRARAQLQEFEGGYLIKRALGRWHARTQAVQRAKARCARFARFWGMTYKRAVFDALKSKLHKAKNLANLLAGLARKYDTTGLQDGFEQIKRHGYAHDAVDARAKKQSTNDLTRVLKQIHRRHLTQRMSDLRNRCFSAKMKLRHKVNMFLHMNARNIRDAFMRWKDAAQKAQTVEEVNLIGPVVEEVLEHRLDVGNLQNFMRKEGYTESQVQYASDLAKRRANSLLSKSIGRMKHYNEEGYVIPKMFDRWKLYVKMRKLAKHWMEYIGNRQQNVKADLAVAFDRWKYGHGRAEKALSRRNKEYLEERALLAARRLNDLAENNNQSEYLLSQLGIQRDELTENKRHAKGLSFALHNNNIKFGMHQALMRWTDGAHFNRRREFEGVLGRNLEEIARSKDKIRELELDNEALANQNEEMRQISLDGYQIARNVQNLNCEREKLSVDLADKTSMIKKLLDENEKLSFRLRAAQDDVDALRVTRAHLRASGPPRQRSPVVIVDHGHGHTIVDHGHGHTIVDHGHRPATMQQATMNPRRHSPLRTNHNQNYHP